MKKTKTNRVPFLINDLAPNSISHLETNTTVPAGEAPRGVYFEIEHYADVCWYVKNHYDDPELNRGSSTITITNKFGELIGKKSLDHLVFRITRAAKSERFVALSFNLRLYTYFPNSENLVTCDISANIPTRYNVQCIDLTESGKNVFYSNWNSIIRLDQSLRFVENWKIPNKFNRQTKAASPDIRRALSILGLPKNPNPDNIKSAFRKSLLKVHPDINRNDPNASDKTRAIVEAYEILTRGDFDHQSSDYETDLGFIQVRFAFDGDSITATQIKTGTEDLYVGCYSGKTYLLRSNGKYKLIYDGHTPVRKIRVWKISLYCFRSVLGYSIEWDISKSHYGKF